MKFKTTTNGLKKALGMLYPIINHNHSTLGMRYVLMRKVGNQIEFKAFNDYGIASSFVDYFDMDKDVKDTEVMVTPKYFLLAKHFIALINSFKGTDVTINLSDDKCTVRCGKSTYKLKVLDKDVAEEQIGAQDIDYYDESKWHGRKTQEIKVSDFANAYNSVSHCISKDNTQVDLQNLCINGNRMIAYNGFLLAVMPFESDGLETLLHGKACDCILNLDKNKTVNLIFTDEHIIGKAENFIFITNTSGDFPIDAIEEKVAEFNTDMPVQIEIDPDEIIDKINRLLMFANAETNAIDIYLNEEELSFVVDGTSSAKEVVNMFKNINKSDLVLSVDGRSLKEAVGKAISKVKWYTNGGEDLQYIHDGALLQFFYGLEK